MNQRMRWVPPVIGQYAGFATRGVALVIDIAVVALVGTIIGIASSLIGSMFPMSGWAHELLVITTGGLIILFTVGYYVVSWTLLGQTVGKYVMGVRVVTVDGGPISMRAALIRYFGYFISALAFFLGYLWVLVDDERRAWHDHLARTMVVYAWPVPKANPRRLRAGAGQVAPTASAGSSAAKR